MSDDLKTAFWNRLDDVQAGLLSAGSARAVPMSPYADPDANAIWFITAKDTDLAKAAESSAEASFAVADSKSNLYATVDGQVTQVDDSDKLDELWNAVAAAWFEDGREDDDIRLIRLTPTKAEVWATSGAAGFLYEIAKARMTDGTPDAGEHGTVSFIN
ncbi:hypothetical protein P775_08705 [Puniceibacterium antarcticum]|uniref:General stress protein FMN-binding split barrel domain-containing protein n=1 Tax=Puniceibacterium antarcticum TaxID=1206336 RepID=A0A2G8RG75_9RHOB|nr:pyridoxamine 5'-phosphate oxidase family protein [Puniceibacterium antarcticum]PIL20596.1 hypothetical protein P775_08705 [Puniceibacterium antarcticum]